MLPNLYTTTIVTSWIDEKEREIFKICKGKEKVDTLLDIYKSNFKHNRKSYKFYTDGSLKKSNDEIIMALGWVLVDQNDDSLVLEEFSAKNFGWPSSTKAEIVAVLSAILTVIPDSKVLIYTDSNNVVSQYNQFKSELSNRRKLKIVGHISWDTIILLVKKYRIDLKFIKVKAHNGIWANEEADKLAKKGLLEEPIQFNDRLITNKFIPMWYNMTIENNPRTFVKTLYQICNEELADNLKRMKRFENANKRLSYKILNRRINHENNSNHETFKDARFQKLSF